MSKLLQVKGTVLPLTEEKVELVGHGKSGEFFGESEVSQHISEIDHLAYDHPITVNGEIIEKIREADLVILSPGSLYTSILPHLIVPEVRDALRQASAPIMYISNLVTQPGETDGYSVSDHLRVLNHYLGERKVDVVIANNGVIDLEVSDVYRTREHKTIVDLDADVIDSLGTRIIADDIIRIENGSIRHDELKTAYRVFSYVMM